MAGNISVKLLHYEHVEQSVDLLTDAFLNRKEPGFYELQSAEESFRYSAVYCLMEACKDKLSFVAVDKNHNERVVGVCVNFDYKIKYSKEYRKVFKEIIVRNNELNTYRMLKSMMYELDKPLFDEIKNNDNISTSGDLFYVYMVGIHKDYQRQGIVTNLIKHSVINAKSLKYKLCYVEASNSWSEKCFKKNNFVVVNRLLFKSWEYPKGSNNYPKKEAAENTGFESMACMIYPLQSTLKFNINTKSKL